MSGEQATDRPRGRPLVGVTMGDPCGIGPEVIAKALSVREIRDDADFVVFGDVEAMRAAVRVACLSTRVVEVDAPSSAAAALVEGLLPVVAVSRLLPSQAVPGLPCLESDQAQLAFIERAVAAVLDGQTDAVVTAPISKASISRAGSTFPGHTEMLAALAEARDGVPRRAVMMLAGEHLRVVPLTTHIPLTEVSRRLTVELVQDGVTVTARTLRRSFGIARPRLAVAGLNPHAGENGLFGREEVEIIGPAIEAARADGINVAGPLPGDTVFRRAADGEFDAVVGMYHDQALIPLKLLDFDRAVNVTLGLPLIRTSVDHGTAYDIAGQGVASAGSMIAALRLAVTMVRSERREHAAQVISA